mmetsp:Transcript_65465/g.213078  ORF Transcript_65465/g.213078 Transcript_65465/m.213078 type:complete len:403 (+) Transcript_65465:890-2098(+)
MKIFLLPVDLPPSPRAIHLEDGPLIAVAIGSQSLAFEHGAQVSCLREAQALGRKRSPRHVRDRAHGILDDLGLGLARKSSLRRGLARRRDVLCVDHLTLLLRTVGLARMRCLRRALRTFVDLLGRTLHTRIGPSFRKYLIHGILLTGLVDEIPHLWRRNPNSALIFFSELEVPLVHQIQQVPPIEGGVQPSRVTSTVAAKPQHGVYHRCKRRLPPHQRCKHPLLPSRDLAIVNDVGLSLEALRQREDGAQKVAHPGGEQPVLALGEPSHDKREWHHGQRRDRKQAPSEAGTRDPDRPARQARGRHWQGGPSRGLRERRQRLQQPGGVVQAAARRATERPKAMNHLRQGEEVKLPSLIGPVVIHGGIVQILDWGQKIILPLQPAPIRELATTDGRSISSSKGG